MVMTRVAGPEETAALMRLINEAFRVEQSFIDADRVDAKEMRRRFENGAFLVADGMAACVHVELRGERGYFGLLSVDPGKQGNGLGRAMVEAAEEYCRQRGCGWMDLTVVSAREELFPFYRKLGYRECGEAPFESEFETKIPVHLVNMEKELRPAARSEERTTGR